MSWVLITWIWIMWLVDDVDTESVNDHIPTARLGDVDPIAQPDGDAIEPRANRWQPLGPNRL